jgi:hypothetical protein
MTERQRFEAWYAREDARWLNTTDAAFMAWCAAIAAEREDCAMDVWMLRQQYENDPDDDGVIHWLQEAEAAIRKRSNEVTRNDWRYKS